MQATSGLQVGHCTEFHYCDLLRKHSILVSRVCINQVQVDASLTRGPFASMPEQMDLVHTRQLTVGSSLLCLPVFVVLAVQRFGSFCRSFAPGCYLTSSRSKCELKRNVFLFFLNPFLAIMPQTCAQACRLESMVVRGTPLAQDTVYLRTSFVIPQISSTSALVALSLFGGEHRCNRC